MDKNKNKMEATVQELKAERVQEELMVVGEPEDLNDPLVISLKAERVQEPESAAVGAGERSFSVVALEVNPYQRVTINLPALQVNIILEQPVAGASWSAGLGEGR